MYRKCWHDRQHYDVRDMMCSPSSTVQDKLYFDMPKVSIQYPTMWYIDFGALIFVSGEDRLTLHISKNRYFDMPKLSIRYSTHDRAIRCSHLRHRWWLIILRYMDFSDTIVNILILRYDITFVNGQDELTIQIWKTRYAERSTFQVYPPGIILIIPGTSVLNSSCCRVGAV